MLHNLLVASIQQNTAPDLQMITRLQDSQMNRVSVDTTAVCTVQIRQDHLATVFLNFGVNPTDAFIVQLNRVVVFTANGDRGLKTRIDAASLQSFKNR